MTPKYKEGKMPQNDGGLASEMSLRDWMAGMALSVIGFSATPGKLFIDEREKVAPYVAKQMYEVADAMIAERER